MLLFLIFVCRKPGLKGIQNYCIIAWTKRTNVCRTHTFIQFSMATLRLFVCNETFEAEIFVISASCINQKTFMNQCINNTIYIHVGVLYEPGAPYTRTRCTQRKVPSVFLIKCRFFFCNIGSIKLKFYFSHLTWKRTSE